MADTPSIGSLAKLAMDTILPFDTSSTPFEFIREDLVSSKTHIESNGIRGTRSRFSKRVKVAAEDISGSILMNPSVTEIDSLMPKVMGSGSTFGTPSTGVEVLPTFQIMIDRIANTHTYVECVVSSCTIRGVKGQPLEFTLNIEAETSVSGETFPAITIDSDASFFIFSECALTLAGSSRLIEEFTLTIDNVVRTDRRFNSLTRVNMPALDRIVSLGCTVPYTPDNAALEDQAVAGAAGSLVLTDTESSPTTYTFTFANVKSESEHPSVTGREEISLPLQRMRCYATASAKEMTFAKS